VISCEVIFQPWKYIIKITNNLRTKSKYVAHLYNNKNHKTYAKLKVQSAFPVLKVNFSPCFSQGSFRLKVYSLSCSFLRDKIFLSFRYQHSYSFPFEIHNAWLSLFLPLPVLKQRISECLGLAPFGAYQIFSGNLSKEETIRLKKAKLQLEKPRTRI
jgi:hypothetical protein